MLEAIRLVDVDAALAGDFIAYVLAHGAEHDDSFATPEELRSFDPAAEPATVAVNEDGVIVGAVSAMVQGYADEGTSRLRILHAAEPDVYPALIEHVLARVPAEARRTFFFLPERAGDIEDALADAGFEITRRAYILRHTDPGNAHAPEFPSEVRLDGASPANADDCAHIINTAFHGQPGRFDLTTERAAELLARPRVVREATLLASRGGIPSGVVITTTDDEDPCAAEIETLAVSPFEQGKGLGRGLLLTAVIAAARHGCRSVSISVSTYNRRAVALYLDSGFHADDIRVCWQVRRPS